MTREWRDAALSGPAEPVPPADRERTLAHLADTVLTALGHSVEHNKAAQAAGDADGREFNMRHTGRHLADAVEHTVKLIKVLCAYNPAILTALAELHATTELDADPGAATGAPERSGRHLALAPERTADYERGYHGVLEAQRADQLWEP